MIDLILFYLLSFFYFFILDLDKSIIWHNMWKSHKSHMSQLCDTEKIVEDPGIDDVI